MTDAEITREIAYEEEFRVIEYKCSICNITLWKRYVHNDIEVVVGDCDHFKWESVGNGCYPVEIDKDICEGTRELAKQRIKKIEDGTTIYFLIPTHS